MNPNARMNPAPGTEQPATSTERMAQMLRDATTEIAAIAEICRDNADRLIGAEPTEGQPSRPGLTGVPSGTLGQIDAEICTVQMLLTRLRAQAERLNAL